MRYLRIFSLFLILAMSPLALFAQGIIDVSGVVLNDQGEPLIGVSVLVRGTETGTMTDANGKFTLRATAV